MAIAVIVIVAALAIFFVLLAARKETIKIGAILSVSGSGSYVGEEVRDGMLLAADEINSWGGIDGRKIELIVEDSKTNPQHGVEVFNKTEAIHHPVLYVSTYSSVSMALAALAEENDVMLVGLAVSDPRLTVQKEWIFRYFPSAEVEVLPIIFMLIYKLKVKRLGILYINDKYGTSVFELLKERFEKSGGTVRSEAFGQNEVNFRERIARLKDMEAIYAVGCVKHLEQVFRQLKEEDFRGFVLGPSETLNLVGTTPEINTAYVAAPIIFNPDYLFAEEAKEKYEARYNKPFTHQAANGYDFVKLLVKLLENKEVSRENMKNLFEEGFTYEGVLGDLDVKPGQHDIDFPLHPAQIAEAEVKYLR